MAKVIMILSFFMLFISQGFSQAKAKTPVVKTNISEMEKLVKGTGLPYKMAGDSMAVIPYGGANIEDYNVIVQQVADLILVYTNLTDAVPGKIDATKLEYFARQNDNFDIVKFGLSNENIMYVRADLYKTTVNTALLTRVIKQVGNVTNIVGGDLKK